jgi:nucleoside-diphosphate-sugar epimerase
VNIFITGSTGFLGRNLLDYLSKGKHNVVAPKRYELIPFLSKQNTIDLLVHSAGKAHSTKNSESNEFFEVNLELTRSITNQIDEQRLKLNTFVFISTVAVYGLDEGENINETAPLSGKSPYAVSKKMAEEHLLNWSKETGINVVILRLPLIFGENAPGNLGAMERAIKSRYYFQIGEGSARRSSVHVTDLAEFIPSLCCKCGVYNLASNKHPSYSEIGIYYGKKYNRKINKFPLKLLKILALLGDVIPKFPLNSYRLSKLNQTLTFNDEKARNELNWFGSNVLKQQ